MAKEDIKEPNTDIPENSENTPEEAQQKAPKESRKNKKQSAALLSELDALKKDLADTKEQALRLAAEYDNFRKRSQREKESAYGDSKANTLSLLLPVIDNFDRAAENKTEDIEVYRKGIEMTLSQFSDILAKLEVVSFGEVGEAFDPSIHNAVMHIDDESLPENSVAAVFSKGYRLGDRILRCADVQVAN